MQPASLVLLSNQQVLERAMDIVANNVANSSTTAFKRQGIEFDTLLERPTPNQTLNFVGAGTTYRDTATGPITPTGNPLDLAIQGQGYFQVKTPEGTRYTRNGSFQVNSQGELVTQAGDAVLDDGGSPIDIPDTTTEINISGDGFVSVRADNGANLQQIGKIGIVQFADEQKMVSQGAGLYATTQVSAPAENASVVEGALEESNVKPVTEMTQMIEVQRAYERACNLISQENTLQTDALNTLSKTTA